MKSRIERLDRQIAKAKETLAKTAKVKGSGLFLNCQKRYLDILVARRAGAK